MFKMSWWYWMNKIKTHAVHGLVTIFELSMLNAWSKMKNCVAAGARECIYMMVICLLVLHDYCNDVDKESGGV